MEEKGVAPSLICYTSALKACRGGGLWHMAIKLLREMEKKGIAPNAIAYNSALYACRDAGQWRVGCDIACEMIGTPLKPDRETTDILCKASERESRQWW